MFLTLPEFSSPKQIQLCDSYLCKSLQWLHTAYGAKSRLFWIIARTVPISLVPCRHPLPFKLYLSDIASLCSHKVIVLYFFISLPEIPSLLPVVNNVRLSSRLSLSTTTSQEPSHTFSLSIPFLGVCLSVRIHATQAVIYLYVWPLH